MSNIVLAERSYRHGAKFFQAAHFSPVYSTLRAASLNSAIGRGLRKSKGVGFRGREQSRERTKDFNDDRHQAHDLIRRTAEPPPSLSRGRLTYDAWRKKNSPLRDLNRNELESNSSALWPQSRYGTTNEEKYRPISGTRYERSVQAGLKTSRGSTLRLRRGKKDVTETESPPKRRSRAARFNDPNYSFGKRALERRAARMTRMQDQEGGDDHFATDQRSGSDNDIAKGRMRPTMTSAARRAAESDQVALIRNPKGLKLSKGRQAYLSRVAESPQQRTSEENYVPKDFEPVGGNQGYANNHRDWSPSNMNRRSDRDIRPERDNGDSRPQPSRMMNDRLPLSIPYTTPASEFLYGTSVVEAALRSCREPRRKLYKLYVYKGENSESVKGQDAIERLASRNNVPIVYHTESPRLLDKMSGGRPHNGYILEASPLPKLPLISLGSLATDGESGFAINLDHQSREEAQINGNSTFIPLSHFPTKNNRKPLILFLDSILDPGNLGGIIRTASFLGITAIAFSTRNSAPLSPIVLKASAGASETVTLFSVNKPAEFIVGSKRAGWKIYAAVAPRAASSSSPTYKSSVRRPSPREASSKSNDNFISYVPAITTDDLLLSSPLAHDPCILMLGSEGVGLRSNLRSKADVEVSIASGSVHRGGGVDSLNVSVAAGVLCQAFLSRGATGPSDIVASRRGIDSEMEGGKVSKAGSGKTDGKEVGDEMDLF